MFDHLVSGKVIAMHAYNAPEAAKPPALTKTNAVFYEGQQELITPPAGTGTWILRIEGVDKHGQPLTKNLGTMHLTQKGGSL